MRPASPYKGCRYDEKTQKRVIPCMSCNGTFLRDEKELFSNGPSLVRCPACGTELTLHWTLVGVTVNNEEELNGE